MAKIVKMFDEVKLLYEEITGQEWKREAIPSYAFPGGVDQTLYVEREVENLNQILQKQEIAPAQLLQPRLSPMMEVTETGKALEIAIELPGVRKSDIALTLRNDILHLRAEKRFDEPKKKRFFRAFERQYGIFERRVSLPTSIDEGSIIARFEEGVLQIAAKKSEPRIDRGQHIHVQ